MLSFFTGILAAARRADNWRQGVCADFVQVRSVAEAWPQALQVPPKRGLSCSAASGIMKVSPSITV